MIMPILCLLFFDCSWVWYKFHGRFELRIELIHQERMELTIFVVNFEFGWWVLWLGQVWLLKTGYLLCDGDGGEFVAIQPICSLIGLAHWLVLAYAHHQNWQFIHIKAYMGVLFWCEWTIIDFLVWLTVLDWYYWILARYLTTATPSIPISCTFQSKAL